MKSGLSGFQRLAVVLLISSAASLATTVWAYYEMQVQDERVTTVMAAWDAAPPSLQTDESALGQGVIYTTEVAIEKSEFYLAMRKWTWLAHLAALALVALAWVADGFWRRRRPVPDVRT